MPLLLLLLPGSLQTLRDVILVKTVGLGTCLECRCLNIILQDFAIPKQNLPGLVFRCNAFKKMLLGIESIRTGVSLSFFRSPTPSPHVSAKQMLRFVPGHTLLQRCVALALFTCKAGVGVIVCAPLLF